MKAIKLRTDIYSDCAIVQAVLAYRDIAAITISHQGAYAICEFENCAFNEDQTVQEFENYVIDLVASEVR